MALNVCVVGALWVQEVPKRPQGPRNGSYTSLSPRGFLKNMRIVGTLGTTTTHKVYTGALPEIFTVLGTIDLNRGIRIYIPDPIISILGTVNLTGTKYKHLHKLYHKF